MKYPIVITSFPRSGNSLVRFIIESVTGRPTLGDGTPEYREVHDRPIHTYIDGMDISGEPVAIKRHFPKDLAEVGESLILVLRDYKECIPSHKSDIWNMQELNNEQLDDIFAPAIEHYVSLVDAFDGWEGRKLLVYYRDLVGNPVPSIRLISEFVCGDPVRTARLVEDHERQMGRCRSMYDDKRVVHTGGMHDPQHYSNLVKHIRSWDSRLADSRPDLRKYLSRLVLTDI